MCQIDWTQVPAWVQAIGSVAAIFVAVAVGNRSARQARELVEKERRRQADIVASTMSNKFHLVLVELERKIALANRIASSVGQAKIPSTQVLLDLFSLSLHAPILETRSNVSLFDRDTGILVNTAIDVLESYNPTISVSIAMIEYSDNHAESTIEICSLVAERMKHLRELCVEAENRLENVHELDKGASQI